MNHDPIERFWGYVTSVLDGTQVAPERIQTAARRSLAFNDDPDLYFDEEAVRRFVTLSESFVISDGHTLNGETVRLMPWQVWTLGSLVGWRYVADEGVVGKQHWVECGRGSGKSALAALLAIFTATEVPGCDISILAGKADQAVLILDSVKRFLRDTEGHGLDYDVKRTEVTIGRSVIKALAAKTHTLDGLRSRLYLLDEGHEYRDDVYGKVLSALPKSRDAQMLSISTPGSPDSGGLSSVYYSTRTVAEESLRDFTKLRSVFAYLYGIDEWDSIEDETVWEKGQPGLGHVISLDDYRRAWETYQAQNREGDFERYALARYSLRSLGWIEPRVIESVSTELDPMDFKGRTAYCGLDLSKSYDLSSLCVQFWKDQRLTSFGWHWIPAAGARTGYRAHAQLIPEWGRHDFVEIVESQTIDYDRIRDRLLWVCDTFDVPKDGIGVDALGGLRPTLQEWEQDYNLPLIGIPQTMTVIGPASFSWESLLREGKMTIRRDPVLEHCVSNVQIITDANGNRRPAKDKSTGVIDAVIAGVQATAVAIQAGAMTPPAYRTESDISI